MTDQVIVLGAELQAAVSMALSRPDLRFLFVSERNIVDGWDLGNVRITRASPADFRVRGPDDCAVALSQRWFGCLDRDGARYALSIVLNRLAAEFPDWVLPVSSSPPEHSWIVKGNLCHRPDAPVDGEAVADVELDDPHRCGNVYQRRIFAPATILATGRRWNAENCAFGLVRIHSEAFGREDFLMAGESVENDEVARRSLAVLEALGYFGFFSMNWVTDNAGKHWLTSFRPVPRSLFQLFRAGGVDLLVEPKGQAGLSAGRRFIVDYHYESYR